jgi:putative membrane protein
VTPLLQLSMRELLLYGLLESRGLVVIGAAYGVLWELGLLERVWQQVFEGGWFGKGFVRSLVLSLFNGGAVPWRQLALAAAGIVVLLLLARLVSIAWAAVRLYGFRLLREADDLRIEFGLFTRVTATIPIRRIQTLTVYESPLQRWTGRASIRVETAGGGEAGTGAGSRERQWLAPIIRAADCREFVRRIMPELDLAALDWQPVHPRAFRRAVKPALFMLLPVLALVWPVFRWRGLWILVPLAVWAVVSTRRYVARLRWAETDEIVAFGSGWLWRRTTAARMSKVQAVTRTESPFDRRAAMAGVRVDTAGAGDSSHRVAVPYLARDVAEALRVRLAERAASTAFRW